MVNCCFQPRFNKTFIITGYTVGGLSLYLIGPAPFLPISYVLEGILLFQSILVDLLNWPRHLAPPSLGDYPHLRFGLCWPCAHYKCFIVSVAIHQDLVPGGAQKLLGVYTKRLSTYSRCQILYWSKDTGKIVVSRGVARASVPHSWRGQCVLY